METLTEVLRDEARLRAVVADGARLIDEEVASKTGVGGLAVKAGFKTVKTVKPGLISEALTGLLPEFAPIVDPYYAKARASGDVRGYFVSHGPEIAEALLAVTDARAERTTHRVIRGAYERLRGQAHKHTTAALPRVAELITRHVR